MIYRKNKKLIINHKLLFCIICSISTLNNAMEITSLPYDILTHIFTYSHPPVDLRYDKIPIVQEENNNKTNLSPQKREELIALRMKARYYEIHPISQEEEQNNITHIKANLPQIANTLMDLRCVNKQCNAFISQNIVAYLGLKKSTINPFLIRSIQADIPYFIKIALANKANPNFIYNRTIKDKSAAYTPLLYATAMKNYPLCTLLLNYKADVNAKTPTNGEFAKKYGCGSSDCCPIVIALRNRDHALVSLFLQNGASLDANISLEGKTYTSLFPIPVYNNDPDSLEKLIDAYSQNNTINPLKDKQLFESMYKILSLKNVDVSNNRKCKALLKEEAHIGIPMSGKDYKLLLTSAAHHNDIDSLKILLTYKPKHNFSQLWYTDLIESLLDIVSQKKTDNDQDNDKRTQCINLLQQTKSNIGTSS
ncbi:MAG TPA: hypothetical protein VKU36_01045 [Candidatus Babeliales bacterium]|nr:hypothetical protein [Candidatus Babeliales bacterium]